MAERLAKRLNPEWGEHPADDEAAIESARWWLNAVADGLETANVRGNATVVIDHLRTQAREVNDG